MLASRLSPMYRMPRTEKSGIGSREPTFLWCAIGGTRSLVRAVVERRSMEVEIHQNHSAGINQGALHISLYR